MKIHKLKSNRFLVFAGFNHYPSGGWNDFQMSTNNLCIAKYLVKRLLNNNTTGFGKHDWAYVVDTHTEQRLINEK